jgi:hypothetical protein
MHFDETPIYFVLRDGHEKEDGPYSLSEIRTRVASGILKGCDLYAVSGMESWSPVRELMERKELTAKVPAGLAEEYAKRESMPPVIVNPWAGAAPRVEKRSGWVTTLAVVAGCFG